LGRVIREESFSSDIRTGGFKAWQYDKDEFVIGTFKNGTTEGPWEWRAIATGMLKLKGEFKNGIRNGMFIFYYPNEQIESKGMFKDGKEEGEHVWYNKDGTIYAIENYKNGQVIR
jgi:antitoxin component YwqK of YwqJK toxin-antitoxin module